MKFIYQYPECCGLTGDMLDAGPIATVAAAVESADWDGFAFTEHPAPGAQWLASGGHQTLDPFVALGHAAAATERIHLVSYLTVAAYRNPLLLAKATTTLDRVSNGRFILGIGIGYHKREFFALGADYEHRGALLDEALEVLPLHWSGEPFSYAGRTVNASEVIGRPRPVHAQVPIWIGGNSHATLRRVATGAQGWMPLVGTAALFSTTGSQSLETREQLAAKIAQLRLASDARGAELDIVCAYRAFGESPTKPCTPEHADAFAELAAIGVTHLVIAHTSAAADETYRFVNEFAAAYLHH